MKHVTRVTVTFAFAVLFVSAIAHAQSQTANDNKSNSSEIEELKRELASLKDKIEHRPKDYWDRLSALSPLLSGLLVTLIGLYATQKYSQRQQQKEELLKEREIAVTQIQTIEKFFPYLLSGDESKKIAALEAVAATGNKSLALKLAHIFRGPSSVETINRMVSLENYPRADPEATELENVLSTIKPSIVRITSMMGGLGTGFFCTSWGLILTLDYIVEDLPKALIKITQSNGATADAQVWLVDKKRGFALLSSRVVEPVRPLEIKLATVIPGAEVITIGQTQEIGQNQEAVFKSSVGVVSDYQVLAPERICVDMSCPMGFSGAPVITKDGELLGIISGHNPETVQAMLIPSTVVAEAFLEQRTNRELWENRMRENYMGPGRYKI